jgi:hypothetical protein
MTQKALLLGGKDGCVGRAAVVQKDRTAAREGRGSGRWSGHVDGGGGETGHARPRVKRVAGASTRDSAPLHAAGVPSIWRPWEGTTGEWAVRSSTAATAGGKVGPPRACVLDVGVALEREGEAR